MSAPLARLNCEQCQRRKLKCDKNLPCASCLRKGLVCDVVQRARLPRGRSGKKQSRNRHLENRVTRIEDLVKQLQTQVKPGHAGQDIAPENGSISASAVQPAHEFDNYVARDFWTALSAEVTGLRDVLEDSEDEAPAEDPIAASQSIPSVPYHSFGQVPFGDNSIPVDLGILRRPPEQTRLILLETYRSRVDKIFKPLHWPTVLSQLNELGALDQTSAQLPAVQSLEFAIYHMAVLSMTEDEVERELLSKRTVLARQYQLATENMLSRADILRSPSLVALQAFTVYISGLHTSSSCASSWTLTALAVRIARAIGLDSSNTDTWSLVDREQRRRLWCSIGVLDIQTALDRGSEPLIPAYEFEVLPLDIDDHRLLPSVDLDIHQEGFTDMSFASLTIETMVAMKKLYESPAPSQGPCKDWNAKLQIIDAFDKSVARKYANVDVGAGTLETFTRLVGQGAVVNMQLILRRPIHRTAANIVPSWDDFDTLGVAVDCLERSMMKRDQRIFNQWAWFSWLKWYALAVVLAELCSRRQDPFAEKAYVVARKAFAYYSESLANIDSGRFWKPIAKLMRRVDHLRGRDLHRPSSNTLLDARGDIAEIQGQHTLNGSNIRSYDHVAVYEPSPHAFAVDTNWDIKGDATMACSTSGHDSNTNVVDDIGCQTDLSWLDWPLSWNHFLDDFNNALT